MNCKEINSNNEWQCLLMDIGSLEIRIANFKKEGKLFRFPFPNNCLKRLCLSTDYFQSRGFVL
jgi:hypothetical protein